MYGRDMLTIKPSKRHNARKSHLFLRRLFIVIIALIVVTSAAAGGYFMVQYFTEEKPIEDPAQTRDEQLNINTEPVTQTAKDSYRVAANYPRYLTIDAAGVIQARIMTLGVLEPDKNGGQQLDAPQSIYDVGWYDCQINSVAENKCAEPVLPGGGNTETAAIIDGHSCNGRECVFNNLAKLKSGDKIVVERGDDKKIDYIVREIDVVNLNDANIMEKMMKPIVAGQEGLNLITCIGDWTARDAQGIPTMNQRVRVFAVRE